MIINLTQLLLASSKMSEKDMKVLIALLIVILVVVMIFGYLQKLVAKIMYYQGLAVDTMMVDIIRTGVIKDTDKKTFRKVARRKSQVLFLKQSWLPFTLLIFCALLIVFYGVFTKDYQYTFFTKACSDLYLGLDFPTQKFFGLTLVSDWPKVSHAPDFSPSFPKYYVMIVLIIAFIVFIWFLVVCQALCSRSLRIFQLLRVRFNKDLTHVNNAVNGQPGTEPQMNSGVDVNNSAPNTNMR